MHVIRNKSFCDISGPSIPHFSKSSFSFTTMKCVVQLIHLLSNNLQGRKSSDMSRVLNHLAQVKFAVSKTSN